MLNRAEFDAVAEIGRVQALVERVTERAIEIGIDREADSAFIGLRFGWRYLTHTRRRALLNLVVGSAAVNRAQYIRL